MAIVHLQPPCNQKSVTLRPKAQKQLSATRAEFWGCGQGVVGNMLVTGHLGVSAVFWLVTGWPLKKHYPWWGSSSPVTTIRTQSYYPDTEPTSPKPILVMLIAGLSSGKYQLCKILVWLSGDFSPDRLHAWEASALTNFGHCICSPKHCRVSMSHCQGAH